MKIIKRQGQKEFTKKYSLKISLIIIFLVRGRGVFAPDISLHQIQCLHKIYYDRQLFPTDIRCRNDTHAIIRPFSYRGDKSSFMYRVCVPCKYLICFFSSFCLVEFYSEYAFLEFPVMNDTYIFDAYIIRCEYGGKCGYGS